MISINHLDRVKTLSKLMTDKGCKFFTSEELCQVFSLNNNKVCHIIGSGWSLNHSKHIIGEKDFVIGFNYSAFADIKFDAYFIELAGSKLRFESIIQYMILNEAVFPYTENIFFKNIWEPKNDLDMMIKFYRDRIIFIKDILLYTKDEKDAYVIVENMLQMDKIYVKQICSSVLALISIAALSGFKKIVLHGIDFYGPHFFDMSEFVNRRKTELPRKKANKIKANQVHEFKKKHKTMTRAFIALNRFIYLFHKRLLKDDVILMAASKKSPSSKILPLYDFFNCIEE